VLADALARDGGARPACFVRVNAVTTEDFAHDVAAVVCPGLRAIVLPKVDGVADVAAAELIVAARERDAGLSAGSIRFVVSVESALGLLNAYVVATSSPRIVGVLFGAEDYANDLGLPAGREGEASRLLHARASVVVAATAARVPAYDGIWPDIRDADGLRRDSALGRQLGFSGKSLIHPGQIDAINEAFSPSAADLEAARNLVAAFEEAEARGDGAAALDGSLVDRPIVERARRVLRASEPAR
jgi:citrate lyase subunit beta/citryl-CoA lyase